MNADVSIDNQTLPVNNEDKRSTIIRVVHNRENPFVQLNKQALWDTNLSLKAVGLWARCMSRPNDWRFCIKELVGKCKEGRKSIDNAMKELIQAGYAYRLEYSERQEDGKYKTSGVEYVFFEFPATQQEKDEQQETFKKSFQNSLFGKSRYGKSRKEHLLIYNPTEIDLTEKELTPPIPPQSPDLPKQSNGEKANAVAEESLDKSSKPKEKRAKQEFTPKVREVANQLLNAIVAANPDYKPPSNLTSVLMSVDLMIRIDNRDPDKILDVCQWALADSFWCDKMCKSNPADYLRKEFARFSMKMNVKPEKKERKFAPSSREERTNAIAEEMERNAI
jgi:hypothetical protein